MHKRHLYGPMGDVGNKKVRMSNLLVSNMCTFLELLARHRAYWCLIEQPSSSWLFKMNMMLALSALLSFVKVTTSSLFLHLDAGSSIISLWVEDSRKCVDTRWDQDRPLGLDRYHHSV